MKTRAELAEENAPNKEGEKTKKSGSKNKRDSPKKRASKSPDKKKPGEVFISISIFMN